jgi:hypothetical protein
VGLWEAGGYKAGRVYCSLCSPGHAGPQPEHIGLPYTGWHSCGPNSAIWPKCKLPILPRSTRFGPTLVAFPGHAARKAGAGGGFKSFVSFLVEHTLLSTPMVHSRQVHAQVDGTEGTWKGRLRNGCFPVLMGPMMPSKGITVETIENV